MIFEASIIFIIKFNFYLFLNSDINFIWNCQGSLKQIAEFGIMSLHDTSVFIIDIRWKRLLKKCPKMV